MTEIPDFLDGREEGKKMTEEEQDGGGDTVENADTVIRGPLVPPEPRVQASTQMIEELGGTTEAICNGAVSILAERELRRQQAAKMKAVLLPQAREQPSSFHFVLNPDQLDDPREWIFSQENLTPKEKETAWNKLQSYEHIYNRPNPTDISGSKRRMSIAKLLRGIILNCKNNNEKVHFSETATA